MVDLRRKWTGFVPYDCSLSMSCMTVVTISLSLVEKKAKRTKFEGKSWDVTVPGALYRISPGWSWSL